MKNRLLLGAATLALIAAPIAPASAHPWGWHHGGGPLFAVGAAVGAIAGATVALATAPFHAVAAIAAPPEPIYAAPAPVAYAAPAPVFYGAPPAYPVYAPGPVVVYGGYGYARPHYVRVGYYGYYGHRYR